MYYQLHTIARRVRRMRVAVLELVEPENYYMITARTAQPQGQGVAAATGSVACSKAKEAMLGAAWAAPKQRII